ncbi:hypothetical protein GPALN_010768 [Globodera pallida]|nr:hypothetical protein GPALN_010768 [Globodera pallida]
MVNNRQTAAKRRGKKMKEFNRQVRDARVNNADNKSRYSYHEIGHSILLWMQPDGLQFRSRQMVADLTTTLGGSAVEMAIFGHSNGNFGDEEEWEEAAERMVRTSVEWRLLEAADQTLALLRERMDALIAAPSAAALAVINGRMPQGQATALAASVPLLMPASCSSVCGGTVFNAPSTAFNSAIQSSGKDWSTIFRLEIVSGPGADLILGALSAGTRKRRHRTIFTEEQLNMLEEAFSGTQYSDVSVREVLADKCNLTRRSLVQESRAKQRKRNREVQQPTTNQCDRKKSCAEIKI